MQSLHPSTFIRTLPAYIKDLDCFTACYHLRISQWSNLEFIYDDRHVFPHEVAIYDNLFSVAFTHNLLSTMDEDDEIMDLLDDLFESDIDRELKITEKECTKCMKRKPIKSFSRGSHTDGTRSHCKACISIYDKDRKATKS